MIRHCRLQSPLIITSLFLAIAGCASLPPALTQNPFESPTKKRETKYSFAQVAEREGNFTKAENTYRELHRDRPKDYRFAHRLGVVLVREGHIEEGVLMLKEANELRGSDPAVLNDLGYAYFLDGQFDDAEATYRRVLDIDGRDHRALNNLALTVGYQGRSQEAYELFRQVNDEGKARANLGYVLAQRGDVQHAMDQYARSLEKSTDHRASAEALVQLTELNRAIDAPVGAKPDVQFAGATERNPTSKNTRDRSVNASGGSEVVVEQTSVNQGLRSDDSTEASLPMGHVKNLDLVQLLGEIESDGEQPKHVDPAPEFNWRGPKSE